MKVQRFILWIALFAAAATGLWSCTQEMDGPGTTDPDKTEGIAGYIGIRLKDSDATALGTPSTKAADSEPTIDGTFNPGEREERAISPDPAAHALLMFDAEGKWFGSTTIEIDDNIPLIEAPDGTRSYYKAQIDFKDGQLPEKLLAVINADPEFLKSLIETLEDPKNYPAGTTAMQAVQQYLTESESAFYTDKDNNPWFTMTSSVYGDNENEGRILAAVPYDETPLSDYIFTDEEDILQNPLTLYVERVVAKFTVYFTQGENSVLLGDAPIFFTPTNGSKVQYLADWTADEAGREDESEETSWKVHIVNWGINAVEPNTFLFKNLSNNVSGDLSVDASFGKEFWWNTFSPKSKPRSYWAVDQHYGKETFALGTTRTGNAYPSQYRFYKDAADTYQKAEGAEPVRENWALDYYSYKTISEAGRSRNRYGVENTFNPGQEGGISEETLKDNGHMRVGTHILLAAQLLIEGYDDEAYGKEEMDPVTHKIPNVKTKYFDGALFLSEEAMVKRSVYSLATQLFGKGHGGFASIDGKFYVKVAENAYEEISYELPETGKPNETYVMEIFKTVPAYIEGGDGWATIGLKDSKNVYIKVSEGQYQLLEQQDIEKLLYEYELTAPVRAFTDGMMYYAIPVLHEKQFDASGKFDASKLHIGDVGVVRNHWYRVTVGSINTLGTPVHDPDQPIIPNHEPEFRSLGVQIEILPWSVIRLDDTIL